MSNYRKMQRRRGQRSPSSETPGNDAFLDIVANLVGILIILVVVVGAHAGSSLGLAMPVALSSEPVDLDSLERRLASARLNSVSLLDDIHSMEGNISDQSKFSDHLRFERQRLLMEIQQLENVRATNELELEQNEIEHLQLDRQFAALSQELNRAKAEYQTIELEQKAQAETIVHYPTPLAKTVFNDEVHVRILQGRIAFVPVDALVDRMRGEWKLKAEKLKSSNQTVETVGPIQNFRLQYTLEAEELQTATQIGIVSERKVAFRRFVLMPIAENIGERVDDALQPNSRLLSELSRLQPDKTTVSIWVYPDSYPEFNRVKSYLQQVGFQTAVWPLPEGRLISGGPDGYRSSAQ